LYNPTSSAISLNNWIFSDGEGVIQFNSSIEIAAGESLIIAKDADSFFQRFGTDADYEWNSTWGSDQTNNATVPDLIVITNGVDFSNTGDFLYLDNETTDSDGLSVDIIVWESVSDFSNLPE
ncbi:MAG: hypothetical protein ACTSRU_16075, partial [Candidatus Hodarchaeales archaeon]